MRATTIWTMTALTLSLGCASAPLGADWGQLDGAARDARAVEALRDLFAAGVGGGGAVQPDREVERCDTDGIVYRTAGDPERVSRLRWADVSSVEARTQQDLPARPETLFVYVRPGTPSADEVRDRVSSPLADAGLVRPYVELRSRPRWSRNRMIAALKHLASRRRRAGEGVASVESRAPAEGVAAVGTAESAAPAAPAGADPASDGDSLDAVEVKLRKLKGWHEEGLIDEAEYEAKRQELLEGL